MSEERALYLVSYDVREPKRLARLHRHLSAWLVAAQYSVFVGRLGRGQLASVVAGIRLEIDERQDDVRLYGLPERCRSVALGYRTLPDGLWATDEGLVRALTGSGPERL